MNDHVVTQAQSKRIGIPAGTVIQVQMAKSGECPPDLVGKMAKWYFVDGERVGGTLDISE